MGRPGKARDVVLTPARVAAGLRLHFEQHEIVEAALVEMPGGAESCDASAEDDDGDARLLSRRGEGGAVPQSVAEGEGVVGEGGGDGAVGLGVEAEEGGDSVKEAAAG